MRPRSCTLHCIQAVLARDLGTPVTLSQSCYVQVSRKKRSCGVTARIHHGVLASSLLSQFGSAERPPTLTIPSTGQPELSALFSAKVRSERRVTRGSTIRTRPAVARARSAASTDLTSGGPWRIERSASGLTASMRALRVCDKTLVSRSSDRESSCEAAHAATLASGPVRARTLRSSSCR